MEKMSHSVDLNRYLLLQQPLPSSQLMNKVIHGALIFAHPAHSRLLGLRDHPPWLAGRAQYKQ